MKNLSYSFLFIVALGFVIISQSVRVIPEGRTGVVFNLSGGVQDKALKEGLHFLVPFVQTLTVYDTRISTYAFSNNQNDARLGSPIDAKTSDGQKVGVEISLVTQMDADKAPEVYQKLRTDYVPVLANKTKKIMQEVVASHVADALYTEQTRKKVAEEALAAISASFAESGFKLHDVLLRKIDFSDEYINAIERKQIALQKAQLAQIRKSIAIKEKEISIIKGEAEAKEVEIKGRAIRANRQVAQLEYLEAIESSDKQVPVIMGLKGNNFVNLDKILN